MVYGTYFSLTTNSGFCLSSYLLPLRIFRLILYTFRSASSLTGGLDLGMLSVLELEDIRVGEVPGMSESDVEDRDRLGCKVDVLALGVVVPESLLVKALLIPKCVGDNNERFVAELDRDNSESLPLDSFAARFFDELDLDRIPRSLESCLFGFSLRASGSFHGSGTWSSPFSGFC